MRRLTRSLMVAAVVALGGTAAAQDAKPSKPPAPPVPKVPHPTPPVPHADTDYVVMVRDEKSTTWQEAGRYPNRDLAAEAVARQRAMGKKVMLVPVRRTPAGPPHLPPHPPK